jgi:peptidoglycan/LPS O-acetylase OafA/YrhL
MMNNIQYRPEIDGLRAIAVLLVIFFHSFPDKLPGGFIGVDVFFVISGYLISGIIATEIRNTQKLSFAHFYAKRIKRIFPALALVLIASYAFGWLALTADEFQQLGRHTAASAGFINNFILWNEAGYFDNASDTKPLLHLWSLGVEEQFYLFWPPLLYLLSKRPRLITPTLAVIAFTSFAINIYLSATDSAADFYLPFSRLWELLIGAAIALRPAASTLNNSRLWAWFGLAALLTSAFLIPGDSNYPGWIGLIPVLAAAVLIYYSQENACKNLLSHPLMTGIGKISYPLYLWHWPLLSFSRILNAGLPTSTARLLLLTASLILAWLTYRYIEYPIRFKNRPKYTIAWLSGVMVMLILVGIITKNSHGFKFRNTSMLNGDPSTLTLGANKKQLIKACGIDPEIQKSKKIKFCYSSQQETLTNIIVGDSKGEALYFSLAQQSLPHQGWRLIGSTAPLDIYRQGENAKIIFDSIINNPDIKTVVLANALRTIFPLDKNSGSILDNPALNSGELLTAYNDTIHRLQDAGKRVVFLIDNPTLPDPRNCISGGLTSFSWLNEFLSRKQNPDCSLPFNTHIQRSKPYLDFVRTLQQDNPALLVYDPTPLLCDSARNRCSIQEGRNFLYSYSDHISDYAGLKIARQLLQQLDPNNRYD